MTSDHFSAKSLEEMWKAADLVIDGVVAELTPADEQVPGQPPQTLIATSYHVTVIEAFKTDSRWNPQDRTVVVTRIGGVRDRGNYLLKKFDPRFPLFDKGERYILFLTHLRRAEYAPALGPDGAYQVTSAGIKARGAAAFAKQLEALSFSDVRLTLLRLARITAEARLEVTSSRGR